jgi:hypothetical protein
MNMFSRREESIYASQNRLVTKALRRAHCVASRNAISDVARRFASATAFRSPEVRV